MKLIFILAGMLSIAKVDDDCASKLNEAFVGSERHWKSIKLFA
jgi:hypothetical protein